ncbi:RNA-binding S4 domain-containing protein [Clostridiaceae bacterium 35-E11]
MEKLQIQGEYIQLDKMLKFVDLVQSGGHAKIMIQEGEVKVNGITEYKRGKKLKEGDVVEVEGIKILITK